MASLKAEDQRLRNHVAEVRALLQDANRKVAELEAAAAAPPPGRGEAKAKSARPEVFEHSQEVLA